MFKVVEQENSFLLFLHWAARVTSALCLAIILFFLFGEGIDPRNIGFREWAGFLFFPTGVFLGLLVGMRKENVGGLIVISSIVGFYLVYGLIINGQFWQGWAFLIFLVPASLFLFHHWFSSASSQKD